jgi:exosortase
MHEADKPMAFATRISLRTLGLTALLGGSVAWAYWPILGEMSGKWFNNPQYSHAYLVPLFSLFLLWQKRNDSALAGSQVSWWGLIPIALAIALRIVGVVINFAWLEAFSLLLLLAGIAFLLGGRSGLRISWLAIAFLVFMIPLPYRVETGLSHPLQRGATLVSTYALQTLGFPAFSEGNVILVNDSRLGVVTACNGLGMLLLFFALATGFALVVHRPWLDRVVIVLSAAPIAILANVIRIIVTAVLYEKVGQEWGDFVYHDLAGWLMMPLALGMLWLVMTILTWVLIEIPDDEQAVYFTESGTGELQPGM